MNHFNHNGVKIFYEIKGDPNSKHIVAFLNGVMASTNSWDNQVPLFEKMGYKIILHDFRGQFLSDKPEAESDYSFDILSQDFAALLDHLQINKKIHVIGTSLGGEAAIFFAANYPSRVKTISIIDSVTEISPIMEHLILLWRKMADKKDPDLFFWGMMPTIYGNDFIKEHLDELKERGNMFKNMPENYFLGQIKLYDMFLKAFPFTNKLKKIKCPSLIVCGQDDFLKPPQFSKIIADNIKNSEYLTIPGSGHVTILEKPEVLNSALLGFILKNS